MKIAYFDCFSGVSGDMMLGALIDAGLPLTQLKHEINKLPIRDFSISANKVIRGNVSGTAVNISSTQPEQGRTWDQIRKLINDSTIAPELKQDALATFALIADAEAAIHNIPVEKVHFHEVGGLDSIIDVVGCSYGLRLLGAEKIFFKPLPLTEGFTSCSHGIIPLPAPATVEILKNVPVIYRTDVSAELVTPTGAAIAKIFATDFGHPSELHIEAIGYGAGTAELHTPNVLRLIIGTTSEAPDVDLVSLIQTNVDNTSPQIISYVIDRLFTLGAIDVWWTSIGMKKSRPGVELSVLAYPDLTDSVTQLLLRETNTLGVRISQHWRDKAIRKLTTVKTKYGSAKVKLAYFKGQLVSLSAEYEDCVELARFSGAPIKLILQAVENSAAELFGYPCDTKNVSGKPPPKPT